MARLVVSAGLLWLVSRRVDVGGVAERLGSLSPAWVAAGLAISALQVLVLAWRWRFTAARLGIALPMRVALGEYYLSILLNQVLPGGVLGDVSRAWRHARTDAPTGSAVRAVVLERASAQVLMTLTAIVSVLCLPWAPVSVRVAVALVGLALCGLGLTWLSKRKAAAPDSVTGRLWSDTYRALFSPGAPAQQLGSALLVVGSYIAVFLVAGRAIGTATPAGTMVPLVAPVLMTMLVPVTIAGWGIREAAATALWGFAGLTPEDGAAISVTYGLIVLVSSAPGILSLISVLFGDRDRRARPPRA
ncbi:MAG: lysylphosphatidylglycerol synthase transmembrane domain-containing protein [Gemmatimonadota bacterium]